MQCEFSVTSRRGVIDSQQSEKKRGHEGRLPGSRRKVTHKMGFGKAGITPEVPDASKSQSSHRGQ